MKKFSSNKKSNYETRGSGKSYKTVYRMLTDVYYNDFRKNVIYIAKDKSLIYKVWEENFQEVGSFDKFMKCIDYKPLIKTQQFYGSNCIVYVDHYISEVKIERLKQKIRELEFEIQQHEDCIEKGGVFL